jgi:hypothetical protein
MAGSLEGFGIVNVNGAKPVRFAKECGDVQLVAEASDGVMPNDFQFVPTRSAMLPPSPLTGWLFGAGFARNRCEAQLVIASCNI